MTISQRPRAGAASSSAGGEGGSATSEGKRFSNTAASYRNGSSIPPGQTGQSLSSPVRLVGVERANVPCR